MTVFPFAYPSEPHLRRHGPAGYKNNQEFKPWLRDEFCFRCVYCLERERWYPSGAAAFSVEHVEPQASTQDRIGEYDNLAYACLRCNSARQDEVILDPTRSALREHLEIQEDGTIRASTPEGYEVITVLHLNKPEVVAVRRRYLRVLALKKKYPHSPDLHQLFLDAFGFPDDLPDLARLRPPGGNQKPDGEANSYYALRQAGSLAATY